MIVVALLVAVLITTGFTISFSTNNSDVKLRLDQIYSSDYNLLCLDNKYFIGGYEDNKIDVIIDEDGNEIIRNIDDVYYDNIYKLKDERFLIYNNNNDILTTYIFDGKKIEKFYEIKDIKYIKPIVYKGIDKEYIVGFVSSIDGNLYLYGLNNAGIVVVNDVTLVADSYSDDTYYIYNENYLAVKNKEDLYGVITLDGEIVIDYKYSDILNTHGNSFIALNEKGKYGIIDYSDNVIIDFKYKVIDQYDSYYLFVNKDNKMALYDAEYKKITGYKMKYNSLIEYDLRSSIKSINLYKVNGKVAVVNNYLEDINGTEYDSHKLYIIDGDSIVKDITEVGFGYDNIVYTYDKNYVVSIYTSDISLLCNIQLNNVKKVLNVSSVDTEVIKINYVDLNDKKVTNYYDLSGKKINFKLGSLLFTDINYKGYISKKTKENVLTIYDLNNVKLNSVRGKIIEKYGNYLVVDNSIYRIVVE